MNANFLIAKNLYGRRLVLTQIVENLLKGQPQGIAPTAIAEQLILLNTLILNLTKHIHSSKKNT